MRAIDGEPTVSADLRSGVTALMSAVPSGARILRLDVSSRDRLSALYADEGGELAGAALARDSGRVRLFTPENDPRLFPAPGTLADILARACEAAAAPADQPIARAVAYRPGKRLVLSLSTGDDLLAFVKIRRGPVLTDRLEAASRSGLWPTLLASFGHDALAVEVRRPVPGRALTADVTRGDRREPVTGPLAASLAGFATTSLTGLSIPERTGDHAAAETQRMLDKAVRLGMLADGALAEAVADAGAQLTTDGSAELVASHGDLHDGQIHLDSAAVSWIDADSIVRAPVEADLANLGAHIHLRRVQSTWSTPSPSGRAAGPVTADLAWEHALRDSMLRSLPPRLAASFSTRRWHAWRRLTFARLAAVYAMRPVWRPITGALSALASAPLALVLVLLAALGAAAPDAPAASPQPLAPHHLRDGVWVEVQGEYRPGKRFKVEELDLKLPRGDDRVEISGIVTAIDPASGRVTVIGVPIETDAETTLDGLGGLETLAIGTLIKTSALRRSGDGFRAGHLASRDPDDGCEIEGYLTDLEGRGGRWTFEVNGIRMRLSSDPEITIEPEALPYLAAVTENDRSRRRSDDDWQPVGQTFLHPSLSIGGRISGRLTSENERDLNVDVEDELVESNLHARTHVRWTPNPWFSAYAEVRWTGSRGLDNPSSIPDVDRSEYQSGPTNVLVRTRRWPLSARLGRIDVEDEREWFHDQNLDGIRVRWTGRVLGLDVGRYRTDITPTDRSDDELYSIASIELSMTDVVRPSIHVITRRDRRAPGDERTWTGISAPLSLGDHVEAWGHGAVARGDYRGKSVRSWASDGTLLLRVKRPLRVSIYGGYAFATGDADRGDGIDREYRDTDLADYSDAMDGLKSFRYYGEFSEPELSNVRIWTAGAGTYLFSWLSLDAVLHGYRQDEFRDRFRSEIPIRPTGDDKELGREVNVIAGIRDVGPIDVKMVWSSFDPGRAFETRDRSSAFEVQIEWRR